MARWREGVFSPQTPAVHWQFNPALSRSKAKHLFVPGSQNHLVVPATSTLCTFWASYIILRPLAEPSMLSQGRGEPVGVGAALSLNSRSSLFLAAHALVTHLLSLHLESPFHLCWEMCSFSCSRVGTSLK